MKRFSLNKKRLSKVLALTLAVATMVPNLPAQNANATETGKSTVTVPEPIATVDFSDASSVESNIAKRLKFTDATETTVWPMIKDDNTPETVNGNNVFYSENNVPERKNTAKTTDASFAIKTNDKAVFADKATYDTTGAVVIATGDVVTATGSVVTATRTAIAGSTNPDDYVWEEVDLTPTVSQVEITPVTGDTITGAAAVTLKDGFSVEQYPQSGQYVNLSKKSNDGKGGNIPTAAYPARQSNVVQAENTFGAGAKINNPFAATATRAKLYDADRYSINNIVDTATAVVKATDGAVTNGQDRFLGDKLGQYTAQEIKAGVTISFWAKVPESVKSTSFIEFYNNESLVYQTDDLAKVWAANIYENNKAKIAELSNDPDSLFYKGEIATGQVVMFGARERSNEKDANKQSYRPRTGEDLKMFFDLEKPDWSKWNNDVGCTVTPDAVETSVIAYVTNNGPFMYFNADLAEEYSSYNDKEIADSPKIAGYNGSLVRKTNTKDSDYSVKVLLDCGTITKDEFMAGPWNDGNGGRSSLLIKTGETNENGEELYTMLMESGDIWSNLSQNSSYANYIPGTGPNATENSAGVDLSNNERLGKNSRVGQGVTGYLALTSNAGVFNRDYKTTGRGVNGNHGDVGLLKGFQADNQGKVSYADALRDDEWHYYTYTITDEWFQMYVDGEAVDPDGATVGSQFNMGSGMYDLNGQDYRHDKNTGDSFRIYSFEKGKATGWPHQTYGYMYFGGETVMSFLTDANTKLYVGGKSQVTAAGTQIADITFYDEALTANQVGQAFADLVGIEFVPEPEPNPNPEPDDGVDVLLGDVNNDKKIDSQDALEILKEDVKLSHTGTYIPEVANVNKDTKTDSQDALEILKHDVKLITLPEEYVKVVLSTEE